jgi:hypothetical protein
MKKCALILKKFWWVLLIGLLGLAYVLTRKVPPIPETSEPDEPEPEVAPDLLSKLKEKKEKVDEEIKNMDRDYLVDDINSDYE